MIAATFHDLRYALRMLRKNPGFSLIVITTLALGIGANAAMFSLTDRVLLQRLPVPNPDQLAVLITRDPSQPEPIDSFSYPMYQDLRDRNDVFSGVIARAGAQMNITYGDETTRVSADLVSGNYFDVLGVRPFAGRLLTQDDDRTPGAHPVVVISYRFWEGRFGKDPSIIGKTIVANEHPLTVLGVTPPAFYGVYLSSVPDVWVPMMMTPVFSPLPPTRLTDRFHQWLAVMARRRVGVSAEQAQASLEVLYRQIRESESQQRGLSGPKHDRFMARQISLEPGGQGFQTLQREMRTSLLLLFGATCVVLLILCANLANLMMARATVRASETAVRLALGASRTRLLRQWLTEGLLLSLVGGFAGVFVAMWIKAGLLIFIPPGARGNLNAPLGWRFAGFVVLLSIVVGLLFSLAPAVQAARSATAPSLQLETRSFTSTGRLLSLRSGLVLLQVALSLPLLIGAVLLLRTLQNLRAVDAGFSKTNVLLARMNPSLNGYSDERSRLFFNDLLTLTRALPGVTAASLASDSPVSGLSRGWEQSGLQVEGYTPREDEKMDIDATYVSPDYFKSLTIPLISGRDFANTDVLNSSKVSIINEKMAQYFFPGQNAVGKRIGFNALDITIVGVVKDAKYYSLRQPMRPHVYTPIMQQPNLRDLALQVRTSSNPESIAGALRTQVRELDPHLPLYGVKTLGNEIDQSLIQERLVSWLATAFGILATLLVVIGLYGVVSFSVVRRTREIGIRVALGAQRRHVFLMVMKHGIVLVVGGAIVGTLASIALSRVIGGLLFGVSPTNALTFASAGIGLVLVAMLACYLPARRATKVNPLEALRYE
jgi:predicted permease